MCPTVEVLPDGWQVKRLGSFCTKIGTGATPRGGSEVYLNSRVSHALVRSQHVFDRHFDPTGLAFISSVHAKELRNAELQSGDVLLNITGDGVTFGRSCIVPDQVLPACVNQHVSIIRPNLDVCDPGYLLSVLTHPAAKDYIESFNSGGSRRAITKGHIESFEIPLPPLPTQQAIAHVLGTLDDLIELNRETNEILEEMARALFKSWFVDFDPVRAKLEGRKPAGMDAATAALFPDHFQDSELGQIPKGWKNVTIGDICEINNWSLGKGDKLDTLEYVEISEVSRGNIGSISTYLRGNEPSRARRRLRHGDTVLSTVRPDRGAYFLALNPPENRVVSTGFAVLTPSKTPWSFVHAAMTQPEVSDHLGHLADGGAYPAVRPEIISAIEVVIPNSLAILDAFQQVCAPLFEMAESNRLESRDLATLRDTLLPKLLSGEVSVERLEKRLAKIMP
jgi:type I restriction enzyme S subunit